MIHLSIKEGLQKEICLVEIDPFTKPFITNVQTDNDLVYCEEGHCSYICTLPMGDWQLIGLCSEVSEEVAKGIVEPRAFRGGEFNAMVGHWQSSGWHKGFTNYEHNIPAMMFSNPLESFQSLLKSKNLDAGKTILLIKK